jgi:DNA-directed RNA polymerase subunit RPC12/RpoP
MIDYVCPHCKRELHIKDKHAGKRGYCRRCGGFIVVPELPPGYVAEPESAQTPAAAPPPEP